MPRYLQPAQSAAGFSGGKPGPAAKQEPSQPCRAALRHETEIKGKVCTYGGSACDVSFDCSAGRPERPAVPAGAATRDSDQQPSRSSSGCMLRMADGKRGITPHQLAIPSCSISDRHMFCTAILHSKAVQSQDHVLLSVTET